MEARTHALVRGATIAAAVGAAALSPVPMADEVLLLPTFLGLGAVVGRRHGLDLRQIPWATLGKAAVLVLTSRAGFNATVAFVPGVAAAVNATTAYALTSTYGNWVDSVCTRVASLERRRAGQRAAR